MRVDIEYIKYLRNEMRKINQSCIEDIEFYEENEKLDFSKKFLGDWIFIGLNNTDFIESDYYKQGREVFEDD